MEQDHKIQAVLFDLGSTLMYFDSTWPKVIDEANHSFAQALHRHGFDSNTDEIVGEYRRRVREYQEQESTEFREFTAQYILRCVLVEKGFSQVSDARLASVLKENFAVSQAHWQPETEAIPTLQRLRELGYRLAIVSNAGDDADVQVLVDKAGIRPYFEVILTSAEAGVRKPNPSIFRRALDRMGLSPAQTVMVGDLLGADILGAHNAGMPGIWITRRADRQANHVHEDTIVPDAVIESLGELQSVLVELSNKPIGR
ncbi:MAG: HAD-IIIA family hydrolase [Anaerolineaceae bacterium]|nr:HAD-IIIA family hydrolase [Anaerolineaceae bacterium]